MTEYKDLNIPEGEKHNLSILLNRIKETGREEGFKIETEVVGGVLNKTWPRKDIDVTIKLGKTGKGTTEIERAQDEFNALLGIARKVAAIGGFEIIKETEPAIDEEFDSPNILKFDGTIQIKPKNGAIIELIRRK